MTTTPAMPEPFAWAWRNKVTGAKGVYFEDPKPFGITSHPDYEWTNLYTEAQPRATLQAQPAEVSDADVWELWLRVCAESDNLSTRVMIANFARAILALRTQADSSDEQVREAWIAVVDTLDEVLGREWRRSHETLLESAVSAIRSLRPQAVPMTEVWFDGAMRLADAYADACFDQGLTQRPAAQEVATVTLSSAIEAIEHVSAHNGPGREDEAIAMLRLVNDPAMRDRLSRTAIPAAHQATKEPR